jgi:hypothetical protein
VDRKTDPPIPFHSPVRAKISNFATSVLASSTRYRVIVPDGRPSHFVPELTCVTRKTLGSILSALVRFI